MAENKPYVSIALSVYNVSPFIRQSMDCLINQSMRDIEILCIDDCSTDDTFDVLKSYAEKDSRIRLYRHPFNKGLSESRNLAIQVAHGEYIIMLDGDDLFSEHMAEDAYLKAQETNADMVIWDYVVFYNECEILTLTSRPSVLSSISPLDKIAILRRPAFTCVKLLKLEVLRNLNIHFPEGLTKQDIPVHWQLVVQLDKIALLPKRLSYYRQQPGSTSNKKGKTLFDLVTVMDIVGTFLKSHSLYTQYRKEYLRSRLCLMYGMYDAILPEFKEKALEMILVRYDDDAKQYLYSKRNNLKTRVNLFYRKLDGCFFSTVLYELFLSSRKLYRSFSK